MTQRLSVIIVGGGASGVLLAAHLLRDPTMDLRVTLVEKRAEIGPGVAYSARQQDHVLNVAAPNMSAFADDPDHFWRWLKQRGLEEDSNRFVFVSRRHYGAYLGDVLNELTGDGRLQVVHADRSSSAGSTVAHGVAHLLRAHLDRLCERHRPGRGATHTLRPDRRRPLGWTTAGNVLRRR